MPDHGDSTKQGATLSGDFKCDASISTNGRGLTGRINIVEFDNTLKAQFYDFLAMSPELLMTFDEYLHNALVSLMWRMADIEYEYNAGRITRTERIVNIELVKESIAAIYARHPSLRHDRSREFVKMQTPSWVRLLKNAGFSVTNVQNAYSYKLKDKIGGLNA